MNWRGNALNQWVRILVFDILFDESGVDYIFCCIISLWWEDVVDKEFVDIVDVGRLKGGFHLSRTGRRFNDAVRRMSRSEAAGQKLRREHLKVITDG